MQEEPRSDLAGRLARGSVVAVLFLTPIAFWPGSLDEFGRPKVAILWVCALVGLAALLVSVAQGHQTIPRLRLFRPAGVFLVVFAMATIFSITPNVSLWGFYARYNGLASLVLCAGVALVIATQYARRTLRLRDLTVALAASSALVSLYAFLQVLKLDPVQWGITPLAHLEAKIAHAILPVTTIGNPNFAGGTLAVTLPFAVSLAIGARDRWRRAGWWAIAVLQVAAIGLTKSRGGLIGGVAGLAVLAVLERRRLRGLMTGAARVGLIAVASLVVVVGVAAAILSRTSPSEVFSGGTLVKRWEYWRAAAGVFASNPVLGTGPDTFYATYGRHRAESDGAAHGLNEAPPDKPHNIYLEYAATTGVLGLGAYLALIAITLAYAISKVRKLDGPERLLLGAFLAALAAYLAQGAVSIDNFPLPIIGWALIGAIAACADPARPELSQPVAPADRTLRVAAGLSALALFPLATLIVNPVLADRAAKVGKRVGDSGNFRGAADQFERATTLDAHEGNYFYLAGIAQENQAEVAGSRAEQGVLLRRAAALYDKAERRAPDQPFFQRAFARVTTALAANVDPTRYSAADRAWRACVDSNPNDWEIRSLHADMLAAWYRAGGGPDVRARGIQELQRIASMRGLEKRARPELARIAQRLGLRASPAPRRG